MENLEFEEALKRVQRLDIDLGLKLHNLEETKSCLFGVVLERLEKVADKDLRANLLSLIYQITTLNAIATESLTLQDFDNIEDFVFYAEKVNENYLKALEFIKKHELDDEFMLEN